MTIPVIASDKLDASPLEHLTVGVDAYVRRCVRASVEIEIDRTTSASLSVCFSFYLRYPHIKRKVIALVPNREGMHSEMHCQGRKLCQTAMVAESVSLY